MKSPITGCILLILGLGLYTVPKDAPRWARTVGLFGSQIIPLTKFAGVSHA
jgi:hypothetical protein